MTSIRLKIEESWYASMDCKVQKSGPWVCFYGGHSTGYKLGNHPKNIEPCAHRARTVRAPCDNAPAVFLGKLCTGTLCFFSLSLKDPLGRVRWAQTTPLSEQRSVLLPSSPVLFTVALTMGGTTGVQGLLFVVGGGGWTEGHHHLNGRWAGRGSHAPAPRDSWLCPNICLCHGGVCELSIRCFMAPA